MLKPLLRLLTGFVVTAASFTCVSIAAAQGALPSPPSSAASTEVSAAAPDLPPPVTGDARITLQQAIRIGIKDNPQITAARYSVLSARENYNSQKSPINPTVGYSALNNTVAPADVANGFSQGTNYSAYATIETNGALRYRTAQAREQFHQAQFDAKTTGLSLKLNIVNAYVALQVANRSLEVELKVYDNMGKLSNLTQKRFDAGAGTEADARRARIAYIQELQNVITDVAGVNSARAGLNSQLGHPVDAPVDAAEPLVYKPLPVRDLAELTALAEKDRPELQAAKANLRSLQAVPGLERSAYYPNIIVGRDFGDDSTVGVGLSIPLDLGSIHGAVAKAKADVKTQEAEVELERQGIDLDVKSSYINLMASQRQVATYDGGRKGGILIESEQLLDQIRQSYVLGANTILDVITAELTYRSVQTAYYSAVGAYEQAAYTLQHSIGDLPDVPPTITLTGIGTSGVLSNASPQAPVAITGKSKP